MYLVKYPWHGRVFYGILADDEGGSDGQRPRTGFCYVEDAVLPVLREVSVDALEPVTIDEEDDFDRFIERERRRAVERAGRVRGLVGKVFRTAAGDGHAWYVVVEVRGDRARIEWRGYSPKRSVDQFLGYEGWFPMDRVGQMVAHEDAVRHYSRNRLKALEEHGVEGLD